jgi:hypothetical protein
MEKENYEPIVFTNVPIKDNNKDLLGINIEANRIEKAIDEGANIIGIIGDYGTGKSSLIEMLKNKFLSVININMWNSVNTKEDDALALTKNFIFQMAIGKSEQFAQYINKKLSKNFNILSISISTLRYWKSALTTVFSYFLYKTFSNLPSNIYDTGLYKTLSNDGTIDLIESGIITNIIKFIYGLCIDFRYLFLLIALGFLARILYKNVMAVISTGATKGERKEDSNDIYGVYLEVANEICNRKVKNKDKNKREDKVLIVIEDLDRINNKNDVKSFIREIYKFNNVLPEEIKEKIVYIIAIKSEESLEEITGEQVKNEKIYSKIFSYKTILNPIHHNDYNKVLLELLRQKKDDVQKKFNITLGEELPQEFFYITKGRNLTIREIKDRLNRSLELYENLISKSEKSENSIEYIKCAVVAYLESEYARETKAFILNDEEFSKVVEDSYAIKQDTKLKNSEKVSKIINLIDNQNNKDFVNEISNMIVNELIDDDFRMYFYNYPRGQKIKSIAEKYVEDLLLYPDDKIEINEEKINEALKSDNDIVRNCYTRRKNERLLLPNNVFKSEILFDIALKYFEEDLLELMQKEIKWKIENVSESSKILENICKFNCDLTRILEKYSEKLYIEIQQLNEKDIEKARMEIIESSGKYIKCFKAIFVNDNMPLITKDELDEIKDKEIQLEMINELVIKEESFNYIAKVLNSEKLNKNEFARAKEIYYKINENIGLESYAYIVLEFLITNEQYDEELFKKMYNAFIEDRNSINEEDIGKYINKLPVKIFDKELLKMIDQMKLSCVINDNILDLLKENNFNNTYWINKILYDKSNELDLKNNIEQNLVTIKNILDILNDNILKLRIVIIKEKLANEYIEIFIDEFPIITSEEIDMIENLQDLVNVVDFTKVTINNIDVFADKFNVICKEKKELIIVIDIFAQNKITDINVINKFFENFIWKKDIVCQLTYEEREYIYKVLNVPLKLTNSLEALKFLNKTNFLIENVEKQIYIGLRNGTINKEDYIILINNINSPTEETIKIITVLNLQYGFNNKITECLLENKYIEQYIISKTLWNNKLELEFDKIDIENYINIYNSTDIILEQMKSNNNFFQNILDKELYTNINSNEKLKPLYKLRQPIKFVRYLIERLSETEFLNYLKETWHLDTEEDSWKFQKLICEDKYIKYLEKDEYYYIVLEKLWKPTHKAQVTRNRNKYLNDKSKE